MQLGLIQFLLGTPAAMHAQGAAEGDAGGDDLFSQLLGDAGGQGGGQQAPGTFGGDVAVNALIAQEVDISALANLQYGDAEKLAKLLGQPIGPQEARLLLDRMAAMDSPADGQAGREAFDQLRQALEQIAQDGVPVETATLLDTLPVMERMESPTERAPLMQRMLQWVQRNLERQEAPQMAATPSATGPDSVAQSLQASLFRPGDAAESAPPPQPDAAAQKDKTLIREDTDATPPSAMLAAMPEWVRRLGSEAAPAAPVGFVMEGGEAAAASATSAMDAAIPPLSVPKDTPAVPQLNLPGGKADPYAAHFEAQPITAGDGAATTLEADPAALPAVGSAATTGGAHGTITAGHTSSHSAALHTPPQEQVQLAITTATRDGIDRITMQLEPADLGRVEIRMETGGDGRTQLSFTVDKSDTLDALARDARTLERALQEAGIKADAGSMQFNLRQQPQHFAGQDGNNNPSRGTTHSGEDGEPVAAVTDGITTHHRVQISEGVDIRA